MSKLACVLLLLYLFCKPLFSQNSIPVLERITAFPDKLFNRINKKADQLEGKLNTSSEKVFERLTRQEHKRTANWAVC